MAKKCENTIWQLKIQILDNINRKRTNGTDENQDAVKVVQALLLKFYGRGPHIPYGVKSAGLSLLAKMQNQLEGNMEPEARESTA